MTLITQAFKNIFHIFRRFKLTSILNFSGISIALVTFFMFFVKVEEQVTHNTCFEGWQDMYRVELDGTMFSNDSTHTAIMPLAIKDIVKNTPCVKDAAITYASSNEVIVDNGKKGAERKSLRHMYSGKFAEDLRFFGVRLLREKDKINDGDIIIPASLAEKLFTTDKAAGDSVTIECAGMTTSRCVAGTYQDFPGNCCIENGIYEYGDETDTDSLYNFNYHVYVMLKDAKDKEKVEHEIQKAYEAKAQLSSNNEEEGSTSYSFRLTNIHETYFSFVDETTDKGDWHMIIILFSFALLIIILTGINNINYQQALLPIRARNINTRMILGADRSDIISGLMAESLILSAFAFITSVTLLIAIDSLITYDVHPLHHIRMTMYMLAVCVIMSLASCVIPAYRATSFTPSVDHRYLYRRNGTRGFSRFVRIGIQILISSVGLTASTSFFMQQNYIFNKEYGYTKKNILIGELNTSQTLTHKQEIKRELEQLDVVRSVSYSTFALGVSKRYMKWSRVSNKDNKTMFMTVLPVDRDYLRTMGVKITEGRDFNTSDNGAYIFNESARRKFPWLKVGHTIFPQNDEDTLFTYNYKVVGFCRDIVFESFKTKADDEPMCFIVYEKDTSEEDYENDGNDIINIRLADDADIQTATTEIKRTLNTICPGTADHLNIMPHKEHLSTLYQEDITFHRQIMIITGIGMSIMLIGIFSLTMFDNENRRKEIAVRKVFGASPSELILLANRKYVTVTLASLAASVPFSASLISYALADYTELCPYLWLSYPAAALVIITLIVTTVTAQSWHIANRPVARDITNE